MPLVKRPRSAASHRHRMPATGGLNFLSPRVGELATTSNLSEGTIMTTVISTRAEESVVDRDQPGNETLRRQLLTAIFGGAGIVALGSMGGVKEAKAGHRGNLQVGQIATNVID